MLGIPHSDLAWLLLIALAVGMLIGAVGVGGILLIPALTAFGRLGIQEAMATALCTFVFTGVAGTILFQRKGSIHWRITVPLCVGALLCSFAGAWLNSITDPRLLFLGLGAVIVFAGVYTLRAWRVQREPALHGRPAAQQALLFGMGAISGFGSGLTGVGGPVLSVPLMVLAGFPVLASVGASQVIQIIAAAFGSLGNLQFGTINFGLAVPVSVLEVAGVVLGTRVAHAVNPAVLRRLVSAVCIPLGLYLIAGVVW